MYFIFILHTIVRFIWILNINGVSNENAVYDRGQFPYSRVKTRGKVLNSFQSKYVLCKIDNLSTHAEVLLVIPI